MVLVAAFVVVVTVLAGVVASRLFQEESRVKDARSKLFTAAYDRDFSTTSVLSVFDADMEQTFGWTVLDTEWEMYGQSKDGAVDVLRMPDTSDLGPADDALTELGYGAADDHGVRVADEQTLAAIAPGLTPQLRSSC